MDIQLRNAGKLIFCICLCELAGALGTLFTASAVPTWYAGLARPALNPPGWVFGPVWTILYALMGGAVFLVWKQGWRRREVKRAIGLFSAQLLANALWSMLFFGMQNPFYALIDICLLWMLILATMIAFYRISKPAAYLLFPYLAWVSFAAYLNYMIYVLN
ncbi:tryptophan-rich sensory protein [Patescibacteria group bacterium]|nr:tryptophan-rich sensory protein [Patescibacteria group bacterium]MBP9710484.1 tryptophan-rich sensory protein [Patescibacteria group bacterium]